MVRVPRPSCEGGAGDGAGGGKGDVVAVVSIWPPVRPRVRARAVVNVHAGLQRRAVVDGHAPGDVAERSVGVHLQNAGVDDGAGAVAVRAGRIIVPGAGFRETCGARLR